MKIAITGATGRMGSELLQVIHAAQDLELVGALVPSENASIGLVANQTHLRTVSYTASHDEAFKDAETIIDFSLPSATLGIIDAAERLKKPLLIATTGLDPSIQKRVEAAARTIPIAVVPNTSLGVYVLRELAAVARRLLGDDFDVEISEIHHKHKKDAPSGTAVALSQVFAGQEIVFPRGSGLRKEGEIGMVSMRGGGVVGEHTVYFLGEEERIELTHRAGSRRLFARGAVLLARALVGKAPGEYSADQLFSQ